MNHKQDQESVSCQQCGEMTFDADGLCDEFQNEKAIEVTNE